MSGMTVPRPNHAVEALLTSANDTSTRTHRLVDVDLFIHYFPPCLPFFPDRFAKHRSLCERMVVATHLRFFYTSLAIVPKEPSLGETKWTEPKREIGRAS